MKTPVLETDRLILRPFNTADTLTMNVIMGQYTVKACNIDYISKMLNPGL